MNQNEKISFAGSAVVVIASIIGYFTSGIYTPAFALGKTGFIAGIVLGILSLAILLLNEKKNSQTYHDLVLLLGMGMVFTLIGLDSFNDLFYGIISLGVLVSCFAVVYGMLKEKGFTRNKIFAIFAIALLLLIFIQNLYVTPASQIARGAGTVLSDNWWESLNWIKNNTPECSIVATYWDPGHFIRAIAERRVIFDGATQGATRTIPDPNGHSDGLVVVPYDNGIKQITVYKNGNATTSRINDIAISLMTSNETLAIETLAKYRDPNCDSMYYIASSDLIGKSTWWSYFSTWDPTTSKGVPSNYYIANLAGVRPLANQDALVYTYPIGQNQAFLLIGTNNTFKAYLQQGNSAPVAIETLMYYADSGQLLLGRDPNAPVKGAFLLQPDKRAGIFVPPELQNSMFTKMFLLNGAGLENFEYVNQWGGEVKLFKVNFPSNLTAA